MPPSGTIPVGLVNSQPMGFYSPSLLIQDARRHGVVVLLPEANASDWDSRIDAGGAVRLGLREISGFSRAVAERVTVDRQKRPFSSVADLAARAGLQRRDLDLLAAAADALHSLAGHRRQAVCGWRRRPSFRVTCSMVWRPLKWRANCRHRVKAKT